MKRGEKGRGRGRPQDTRWPSDPDPESDARGDCVGCHYKRSCFESDRGEACREHLPEKLWKAKMKRELKELRKEYSDGG